MKKLFTSIFFMVLGLTMQLVAQSQSDLAQVLQKCIDLPELQQYYPLNSDGSIKPLYIMQYPISFSSDQVIEKAGGMVKFMTKSDIAENKVESYFMFRSLNINQNAADVNYNYFYSYNYTSKQFKMLSVILELQKTGPQWKIINVTMKGDIL
jgi:hypothetical protein